MREIKYRYVFRSKYDGGWGKDLRITTYTIEEIEKGNVELRANDNWELLSRDEYTGLNDKKRTEEYPEGQEIYEGDIIKVWMGRTLQAKPMIVTWGDYGWSPFIDGMGDNYFLITECKVIGNIYENHELLEVK